MSHLWSTQLAEALPWKTVRAYRFPRANHINVLKTLVQIVPMNSRVVVFQDSLVTLGSHAKGRSSSRALNRILKKSMAVQLAKNVFASGFHCPTWALRADDPSRQKQVRPPRVPLPSWFLALRAGQREAAQDTLDACSGNPRSWGRWLLFGYAAVLASSAGFSSVGAWTTSAAACARKEGPRAGPCHQNNSCGERKAVGRVCSVDGDGGHRNDPVGSIGEERSNRGCDSSGRVWASPVRTGRDSSQLRRDGQRGCSATSVSQDVFGGSVAPLDDLGNALSQQGSSSFSSSVAQGGSDNSFGVGLASFCVADVDRLLCLVTTLRTHCAACKRLLDGIGDWALQRSLSQATAGQGSHSRSPAAKRKIGCAVRRQIFAEKHQNNGAAREALAILFLPVSEAHAASSSGVL